MKFVVVLCVALLAMTIVYGKKHRPQDEEHKSARKVFKECQKDNATHVEPSVLKKLKKNRPVDLPDNFGLHKICVVQGAGYIKEDGTINEALLRKRVTKKAEEDQDVEAIVTECKVPKDTREETAINLEKCLNSHYIDI